MNEGQGFRQAWKSGTALPQDTVSSGRGSPIRFEDSPPFADLSSASRCTPTGGHATSRWSADAFHATSKPERNDAIASPDHGANGSLSNRQTALRCSYGTESDAVIPGSMQDRLESAVTGMQCKTNRGNPLNPSAIRHW
ncbi:MAG: hypothetical protein ABI389_08455 [Rhodanobacter sp.]